MIFFLLKILTPTQVHFTLFAIIASN